MVALVSTLAGVTLSFTNDVTARGSIVPLAIGLYAGLALVDQRTSLGPT